MRLGAAGILIKDKKILLLKRSSYTKAYPGFWTIPGGRQDNDESAEELAIREVKEESGLDFVPTELFHSSIVENSGENIKTNRFLGSFSGNISIQEEEADGYGWYTFDETKKLDLAFDYKNVIELLHNSNHI